MKLNEAVKETIDVNKKMPGKKWSIYQRFNDLVEEVGELSNAIQVKDGWKTKNRSKSPLINSLGDVLYSVLLISDYYKVDLEKEYPKVLKEIDEHREKGDFNHG
ncbi:MazG-like family protein [Patescibacteria group bacterium]|nr:MazG-like family protein [Patescibacteria group bacterium]